MFIDLQVLLDLGNYGERPVMEADGRSKARELGAIAYMECSALTQKNMKEVFDLAIATALSQQRATSSNDMMLEAVSRKGSKRISFKTNHSVNATKSSSRYRWKRSLCCFLCR